GGHAHHGHDHHHPGVGDVGHKLAWAFGLTALVLVAEGIGAYVSGSLSLLADAGHVLTDLAALGLAWFANRLSLRPASAAHTFGYHRSGILAALANAVTLIVIALLIAFVAVQRLNHPQPVEPLTMLPVAIVGLLVNVGLGVWLSRGGGDNVNVRAAMLHVIGDALASVGVIIAGLVIWQTGWMAIDPLLSVAISLLIGLGAWQIVNESLTVLMEGVPKHIDSTGVAVALESIAGVRAVHDLHIWTIGSGLTALSCHALIDDQHLSQGAAIIQQMTTLLEHDYGIHHVTIQPECESCDMNSVFCQLATPRAPEPPAAH
ncbi:MAG: cation transporter, partial [Candidatus Sericytochromatia bacterium]|nr:cation transporter [Candidatus Sericytochromatia bacterium]